MGAAACCDSDSPGRSAVTANSSLSWAFPIIKSPTMKANRNNLEVELDKIVVVVVVVGGGGGGVVVVVGGGVLVVTAASG